MEHCSQVLLILILSNRVQKINEMVEARSNYEAQMQSTQVHIANLAHNISTTATRDKELKGNVVRLTNEINTKEKELVNIQKQRDNKLVVHGEEMLKIVAEIERNSRKVYSEIAKKHLKFTPNYNMKDCKAFQTPFTVR